MSISARLRHLFTRPRHEVPALITMSSSTKIEACVDLDRFNRDYQRGMRTGAFIRITNANGCLMALNPNFVLYLETPAHRTLPAPLYPSPMVEETRG